MKKRLLRLLTTMLVFVLAQSLEVCAEGKRQDAVMLKGEDGGVAVQVTLPRASGEKISSLQISLNVKPQDAENIAAAFEFSPEISGKAKVKEALYNAQKGTLSLYIAGTKPLFENGADTITLGRVTASGGAVERPVFSVGVVENSLKFPGGSGSEIIELLEYPELSSGAGSSVSGTDGGSTGGGNQNSSLDAGSGFWTDSESQDLRQTLEIAKGYSKDDYTLKSYAALSEAIEKAEELFNNPAASKEEKEAVLQELQNAVGALVSGVPDSAKQKSRKNQTSRESVSAAGKPMGWIYALLALEGMLVAAAVIYGRRLTRVRKYIPSGSRR